MNKALEFVWNEVTRIMSGQIHNDICYSTDLLYFFNAYFNLQVSIDFDGTYLYIACQLVGPFLNHGSFM